MKIDFNGNHKTSVVYYTKTGGFLVEYDTFTKAYDTSYKAYEQYDFITGFQIN